MKITFCWKDPERYIVVEDGDKEIQEDDIDWDDPEWIKTYDHASSVLDQYASGEYVFITVDTETGKASLDPNQNTSIPLPAVGKSNDS